MTKLQIEYKRKQHWQKQLNASLVMLLAAGVAFLVCWAGLFSSWTRMFFHVILYAGGSFGIYFGIFGSLGTLGCHHVIREIKKGKI